MSPAAEAYYKPQIPKEYRDDRTDRERRYDESFGERKRSDEDRRYSERRTDERTRYPEDIRYEVRRYGDERKALVPDRSKLEGRNYRKELLERFSEMDLDDHHELPSHQRYYE